MHNDLLRQAAQQVIGGERTKASEQLIETFVAHFNKRYSLIVVDQLTPYQIAQVMHHMWS